MSKISKDTKHYLKTRNFAILQRKIWTFSNKFSGAFSMLELVFVIVILGILAGIAIPKFSLTRIDAQIIAIENDANNALSAIQREVFSQNLDPASIDTDTILRISGLSNARWTANADKIVLANNGILDSENDCVAIYLDKTSLILNFEITQKSDSSLCARLFARHPDGGKKIPINTSNAVF